MVYVVRPSSKVKAVSSHNKVTLLIPIVMQETMPPVCAVTRNNAISYGSTLLFIMKVRQCIDAAQLSIAVSVDTARCRSRNILSLTYRLDQRCVQTLCSKTISGFEIRIALLTTTTNPHFSFSCAVVEYGIGGRFNPNRINLFSFRVIGQSKHCAIFQGLVMDLANNYLYNFFFKVANFCAGSLFMSHSHNTL